MQTPTIDAQIRARSTDDNVAIVFEGEDGEVRSWTYREYVECCAERAARLLARRSAGPLHVGLLLDNVPEFPMWLGAAAVANATIVGVNPTRRGADLARDSRHTDCQLVVTEPKYEPLLRGLDIGLAPENVLVTGSERYTSALAPQRGDEEVVLAREVAVEGCQRTARLGRYVTHSDRFEAPALRQPHRRIHDPALAVFHPRILETRPPEHNPASQGD